MNRLLEIGFEPAGNWIMQDDRLVCELTCHATQRNVLYAFICDGEVMYVGKTTQSLRTRMNGYQNPGTTQITNLRNNASLRKQLAQGASASIVALPDNGLLRYGQFHLNLAAGLEDALIRVINPPWNGGLVEDGARPPILSPTNLAEVTDHDRPESATGIFTFVLRHSYFNKGFFNVGVAAQSLLGADGEIIEIYLDADPVPIIGTINRRANSNGTPRIMSGLALRNWFQKASIMDAIISVEVISSKSIRLIAPASNNDLI